MKLLICTQVVDKNHPILGFFHGWIFEFAKHFKEVHVICLQKGTYNLPDNVFIYSLGKEEGENHLKYLVRFYRYFGRIFFSVRVDFVFFHMGYVYNNLAAPFFFTRKLFGTQFFWWKTHGTLNIFGRTALFLVDAVYTAATESFPLQTKKKRAVGHAIDIDSTHPFVQVQKATPPILLFVGRISPVKHVEVVIETAEILHARGVICQVRIVGVLHDLVYAQMLREKIEASTVGKYITLVGPKKYEELREEYEHATVLLNPSQTGGIDKVVLEAMKFGVPPLALHATYGSLLTPFGLTIERQDASLYAEKVLELISDTGRQKTLAIKLYDEVLRHHALSTLTKRIFNI